MGSTTAALPAVSKRAARNLDWFKYRTAGALAIIVGLTAVFPPGLLGKNFGWNADALVLELESAGRMSPPAQGVAELKFSEFHVTPIGPRGLEPTEKLRQLNGRKVRILGFMVNQARPAMGVAMLTGFALTTHEGEYGLCDDLPAATLFVEVPKFRGIAVPFTPGPLLLTGRLELGRREESDGRVSHVRLVLDPESPKGTSENSRGPASGPAEAH